MAGFNPESLSTINVLLLPLTLFIIGQIFVLHPEVGRVPINPNHCNIANCSCVLDQQRQPESISDNIINPTYVSLAVIVAATYMIIVLRWRNRIKWSLYIGCIFSVFLIITLSLQAVDIFNITGKILMDQNECTDTSDAYVCKSNNCAEMSDFAFILNLITILWIFIFLCVNIILLCIISTPPTQESTPLLNV